ncbi:MAG: transcription-repair coupling factor (superfamily II helicase), partial [Candidatus Azotimanducaceae bacterium]
MANTLPLGVYQIPDAAGKRRHWGNLDQAALSLAVADAIRVEDGFTMVVVRDTQTAESVSHELQFFLPESMPVMLFPDWETLIYDSFSPHQDIVSDRLAILNELPLQKKGVLVVPATTLMQKLAPRSFTLGSSFVLDKGQRFDIEVMRKKLTASAYRCVDTVFEHGEFAVRGSIMDIFPMGVDHPFRLDLFDDEIESIRVFDPETQRSIEHVESIRLLSAREFPLTDDAINRFQDRWHQHFQGNPRNCQVYQDVSQGLSPPGIEYYLPLFFDELETLFDYLPDDTLVLTAEIDDAVTDSWQSAESRYENLRYDIQRPIVAPSEFLLPLDEIFSGCNLRRRVSLKSTEGKGDNFPFAPLPELTVNDRLQNPLTSLTNFLSAGSARLVIVAESNGRREVVDELLRRHHIEPEHQDSWTATLSSDARIVVTVSPLERGFYLPGSMLFITEQQLFGEHVLQKRRRAKQKDNVAELVIKSLTELNIGSPVVHIDHGVGRYLGLETLHIDGQETEFLALGYDDEAKLYVPVSSLHLISRYAGSDETTAPLHRLGSEVWEKAKRKAAEQVRDVAAELLNIYARREAKSGFAFP